MNKLKRNISSISCIAVQQCNPEYTIYMYMNSSHQSLKINASSIFFFVCQCCFPTSGCKYCLQINVNDAVIAWKEVIKVIRVQFNSNWNAHKPLIVVRLVVPDFWSHIIRCANICMSVGLRAAKNDYKINPSENATAANEAAGLK